MPHASRTHRAHFSKRSGYSEQSSSLDEYSARLKTLNAQNHEPAPVQSIVLPRAPSNASFAPTISTSFSTERTTKTISTLTPPSSPSSTQDDASPPSLPGTLLVSLSSENGMLALCVVILRQVVGYWNRTNLRIWVIVF